ncbi:hypothetical protein H6F88_00610 [Oculatella sp. FACHB-28]|nr:hypothetical protein [Oculatella sp. FACHB-28]
MSFLFVGSQICRQLPSDPPSQERPCFKLGVVIARICNLTIWMLVLLQGTFTPLVHTHAGRTQVDGAERSMGCLLSCKGYCLFRRGRGDRSSSSAHAYP